MTYPRARPVGEAAATLELAASIDPETSARVRAVDQALRQTPFAGFREAVPTHRSLLVVYDPLQIGFEEVRRVLESHAREPASSAPPGALHRIPVVYGGADGPDLADVARACGLREDEVGPLHSAQEYTVYMLGFMPGFPYLGPLPAALDVPRLATPRTRVPAGAVAVANGQTAVYPGATPGGWSIIGRTGARLFDARRDPPCLLQPGDRVRFDPVRELPPPPPSEPAAAAARADASLEVTDGGLLTTVQDGGRFGHRRLGVPWAGAADPAALRAANLLVGNPPGAAALECTAAGPALRFLATIPFAVAGADLGAVLERDDMGAWPVPLETAVLARAGNHLVFRGRRWGCRAYVALQGGIDVPLVLGSRATFLGAAFGGYEGRALRAGDRLALLGSAGGQPSSTGSGAGAPDTPILRVVLGPQDDEFAPGSVEDFLGGEYAVAAASDRVGCRLDGPRLRHLRGGQIPSDGLVPGSVQVPPDGLPIVSLADGPTTGGYPKVATVIGPDLPLLAQLLGGEGRVRFRAVTVDEAQRAARERGPLVY